MGMGFNYELARAVARGRDRDTARFFAGRLAEIRRFDDALAELDERGKHDRAAEFVIYQGAPGCGKTSLLNHLRELPAYDDVLFVTVGLRDLAHEDPLKSLVWGHIEEAAPARPGEIAGFAETSRRPEQKNQRVRAVVLHLDEAQVVDETAKPGLLMLHTAGLGYPCAMVMTGLGHTKRRVSSISGLSRLAGNATVGMAGMAVDECAESTLMMLRELDVDGTDGEKESAADLVATLSQGWPHHLCGAQIALCRELLGAFGVLRDVDTGQVRRQSHENRHAYYFGRLAHSALAESPRFSASLVAKVDESRPTDLLALEELCREERDRSGRAGLPEPAELANALIEKGAVTITVEGNCEVPIPSMAEWAKSMAADGPPSARPTGRRRDRPKGSVP